MQDLEQFTCIMYGNARETSVDSLRVKMLKKMCGDDEVLSTKSKIDLSRIPPCRDSLVPHSQRSNHRMACHKRAQQQIIEKPKPDDPNQGWTKEENGVLQPIWSNGPILPLSLIDLLSSDWEVDDEDDEECEYMDYDDIFDDEDDE